MTPLRLFLKSVFILVIHAWSFGQTTSLDTNYLISRYSAIQSTSSALRFDELPSMMDEMYEYAQQTGNADWLCRTAATCAFFHIHLLTQTNEESHRLGYEAYNHIIDSVYTNHLDLLSLGAAKQLFDLSNLERNIGSAQRALTLTRYVDEILLIHGLEYSLRRARLYRHFAKIYDRMGMFEQSINYSRIALDILEADATSDENRRMQAQVLATMAAAYYSKNSVAKAILLVRKSMVLSLPDTVNEEGRWRMAYYHMNLGVLLTDNGSLVEAEEHINKGYEFYANQNNQTPSLWGWLYSTLGLLAEHKNDPMTVDYKLAAYEQNKLISHDPGRKYASHINYLGSAYKFKTQSSDTLLIQLRAATDDLEKNWSHPSFLGQGFILMGAIKNELGAHDSALFFFNKALTTLNPTMVKAVESNGTDYENTISYDVSQNAIQHKARANLMIWKKSGSQEALDKALEISQSSLLYLDSYCKTMFYPGDKRRAYERAVESFDLALESVLALQGSEHKSAGAFLIMERGKGYLLSQALYDEDVKYSSSVPDSVRDLERELKGEIGNLGKRLVDASLKKERHIMDSLLIRKSLVSGQLDSLLEKIRKDYPVYSRMIRGFEPVSLATTQQGLLTKYSAMVSYYTTDERIYIMAITEKSAELDSVRLNDELKQLLGNFQNLVSDYGYAVNPSRENYQQFVSTASAVYQALFPQNTLSLIADKEEWIVMPDGILSYLPFEAMLTHEPKEQGHLDYGSLPYLIKERTVRYAYSATWLSRFVQTKPRPLRYLGIAPGYDTAALAQSEALRMFDVFRASPSPLLGNIEEVNNSMALFDGTVLKGSAASEEAFKSMAADYNVLHFAMHGLMDNDHPMNSQLLFSTGADTVDDGSLYAYELYNLTLNADLVVMSACNSGNGKLEKGEGIMSMARSFSDAGCPGLVMSLWQAEDRSVSDIVTSFFQHLESGESKSTSLREAKLEYLETAEPSRLHPFYWAGMVMMGDDQPLVASMNWMYWLLLAVTLALIFTLGYRYIRKTARAA